MSGLYERGQQTTKCKETGENVIIRQDSVLRPDIIRRECWTCRKNFWSKPFNPTSIMWKYD